MILMFMDARGSETPARGVHGGIVSWCHLRCNQGLTQCHGTPLQAPQGRSRRGGAAAAADGEENAAPGAVRRSTRQRRAPGEAAPNPSGEGYDEDAVDEEFEKERKAKRRAVAEKVASKMTEEDDAKLMEHNMNRSGIMKPPLPPTSTSLLTCLTADLPDDHAAAAQKLACCLPGRATCTFGAQGAPQQALTCYLTHHKLGLPAGSTACLNQRCPPASGASPTWPR